VDRTLKIFLVNFVLDGADHFRRDDTPIGAFFQDQKAERADIEKLGIGILRCALGLEFSAQGVLDDGFERGTAAGGDGLGLDEKVIR